MKPTTEPQSHLVSQNAQAPLCLEVLGLRLPAATLAGTSPVKSVASAPFRQAPSAGAAPQAAYGRRPVSPQSDQKPIEPTSAKASFKSLYLKRPSDPLSGHSPSRGAPDTALRLCGTFGPIRPSRSMRRTAQMLPRAGSLHIPSYLDRSSSSSSSSKLAAWVS